MTKELQQHRETASNREWKSSAFTTFFGTPERAAELYQALEHTEDVKPEDIEFTTLQGVLFLARKNDLAFTAHGKVLVIGEHQSTINQNMPLRDAIYYGRTMERLIPPRDIYKTKQLRIPTPEFYVFYNGNTYQPPEQLLKLSDSYLEKTDTPMLELYVKVININLSAKHPILQKSPSMYEYSAFVQLVRDCLNVGASRDAAIQTAMRTCAKKGIMVDFIRKHGSEVENMLFTEFNMEDALEVRYEEGMEDGIEKGVEKGERLNLIRLVMRKLQKGKTVEQIAEELEESPDAVRDIMEAAKGLEDSHDCEQLYRKLYPHGA